MIFSSLQKRLQLYSKYKLEYSLFCSFNCENAAFIVVISIQSRLYLLLIYMFDFMCILTTNYIIFVTKIIWSNWFLIFKNYLVFTVLKVLMPYPISYHIYSLHNLLLLWYVCINYSCAAAQLSFRYMNPINSRRESENFFLRVIDCELGCYLAFLKLFTR